MNSRFQAKPRHSRSSLYKACRTAALFSLIMSPLVVGVCLHSSLDQTEPHVFILSRDGQTTSQASLVILGAVDSVSRLQPPGKMMMMVVMLVLVVVGGGAGGGGGWW